MVTREGYVTEIAKLFPRQGQWTEADYFRLPESKQKTELANGELIVAPSPNNRHQTISMTLSILLGSYVKENKLGAILAAPFDVRLFPGTIRQPDLLFVTNEHLGWLDDKFATGRPDWVAEIISPDEREIDEVTKLEEYARAGIPEYWLLDPEANSIRVYNLQEDAYTLTMTALAGQVAHSSTIAGFEVAVDEVFDVT